MITTEKKQKIIADLAKDKKDTGSPEVQVGILTARINEITEHLKINKKDLSTKKEAIAAEQSRKKNKI